MQLNDLKLFKKKDSFIIGEHSYEINQSVWQPAHIIIKSDLKKGRIRKNFRSNKK